MKKTLFVLAVLFLAVGCQKNNTKNEPPISKPQTIDYYSNLNKQCGNDSCCLSSVKTMQSGNFKLAENNLCPEGMSVSTNLCLTSKKWCEPKKNNLETYSNSTYGFEIKYPKNEFSLFTDYKKVQPLSYIPVCNSEMVGCLYFDKANLPQTNFTGAGVSVDVIKDSGTESNCLMQRIGEDQKADQSVNGVKFAVFSGNGAATSHYESYKNYRTFWSGSCINVTLRITSVNLGVLDTKGAGAIKEFNEDELWNKLEQTLLTFVLSSKNNAKKMNIDECIKRGGAINNTTNNCVLDGEIFPMY